MNIQTIEGLGYKILITEYITKDVQRRTHKKKRINKKCYEKLKKLTDKDADNMEEFLKKVTNKQSQE